MSWVFRRGIAVALAIEGERFYRSAASAAKNEQAPGERVGCQFFAAKLRQPIYTLPQIDWLDRHQNPHGSGDLNHLSVSRQACSRLVQSGGVVAFQ